MSLVSGAKLRPYEIVAALAAGYSVSVAEKIATAKERFLASAMQPANRLNVHYSIVLVQG